MLLGEHVNKELSVIGNRKRGGGLLLHPDLILFPLCTDMQHFTSSAQSGFLIFRING